MATVIPRLRRILEVPAHRLHLVLMLTLTFTTGMVDAIGFLGLDRVFTGNMTGNVVILGMALVGADMLPVLGPALALAGFMAGAALGGRVLRHADPGWSGRTTCLFAGVAFLMLVLGVGLLALGDTLEEGASVTVASLLGAAMGTQAAVARFLAVKDVTTVVITSTITGLAADSAFGGGKGRSRGRRIWAIVLILVGAAVGAVMVEVHLGIGLVVAGMIVMAATLLGAAHARLEVGASHATVYEMTTSQEPNPK